MRLPTRKKELERMHNEEVDVHVTKERFAKMQRDLKRLIDRDRPEAVAEVRRTGEMGDFSENAGYQIAKTTLRRINTRIDILEDRIARAVIIDENAPKDVVRIGSTVTVRMNDREFMYQILGSQESNPSQGKISHNSPIGKALLGARIGDAIEVQIGDRSVTSVVVTIA